MRVSHNKYLISARTWSGGEVAEIATGETIATAYKETMATGEAIATGELNGYRRGRGTERLDSA